MIARTQLAWTQTTYGAMWGARSGAAFVTQADPLNAPYSVRAALGPSILPPVASRRLTRLLNSCSSDSCSCSCFCSCSTHTQQLWVVGGKDSYQARLNDVHYGRLSGLELATRMTYAASVSPCVRASVSPTFRPSVTHAAAGRISLVPGLALICAVLPFVASHVS